MSMDEDCQRSPEQGQHEQSQEQAIAPSVDQLDRRLFQLLLQQNITHQYCGHTTYLQPQAFQYRNLPIQAEYSEPVFNISLESEQNMLCHFLDADSQESLANIAMKVENINGNIQGRNFTGLSLLQFWKMQVVSGKHTWRQFYNILLELNCNKVAQQFKVVYEKDKLITEIDVLKETLPLRDILTELVQESIITTGESIELSKMGNPEDAVVDLIWNKIMRRGHNVITKFHKVLYNQQYCHSLVERLVLCIEHISDQVAGNINPGVQQAG